MMLSYKYEISTKKNLKAEDKPNEDLAVFNETLAVGMVLDGVTRDRENGVYPNPSPAMMAARLFADAAISRAEMSTESGLERIRSLICAGNEKIKEFNRNLQHPFPAGTVGIVFCIENNNFCYGYIGDCYSAVIRNGLMRIFTECQTREIARRKNEFTSDEIRFDICNHINHPCGYGVWDGAVDAMDFVKYGSIKVKGGDVLMLYTDGMALKVEGKTTDELVKMPLCLLSNEDTAPDQDDATCMRITMFD